MGDDKVKKTKEQLRREAQSLFEYLNEEARDNIPLVGKIRKITGIPEALSTLLIIIYIIWQAWNGVYAELFAILVGTIYPAFKSVQALQTDTSIDDDRAWLTYWIVYGTVVVADVYVHIILQYIPAYYFVKLCFFLWLQIPGRLNGAYICYRVVFRPMFMCLSPIIRRWKKENSQTLCDFDKEVQNGLKSLQSEMTDQATSYFVKAAMDGLTKGEGN